MRKQQKRAIVAGALIAMSLFGAGPALAEDDGAAAPGGPGDLAACGHEGAPPCSGGDDDGVGGGVCLSLDGSTWQLCPADDGAGEGDPVDDVLPDELDQPVIANPTFTG